MIIDKIENASMYYALSEGIATALKFLQENDFAEMKTGRYEIDGDRIFANVSTYETRCLEENSMYEAHCRYIDVQYMVQGVEKIGYSNIKNMKVVKEYDTESDFMLLSGQGDFFTFGEEVFAILAPEDAHMPGMAVTVPQPVKKVVVKVRV